MSNIKNYKDTTISWLSRLVAAGMKVAIIPIVLNYLGVQLYATFVITLGLEAWFLLLDFGSGDCIQNKISELRAKNIDTTKLYSNATALIACLAIILTILFCTIAYPLQKMLFHKLAPHLPFYFLMVIGSMYVLKTLCEISYRVFIAEHRPIKAYLYQAAGPVCAVIIACFIMHYFRIDKKNRLFIIACAWVLPMLFFAAISLFQALPTKNSIQYWDFKYIKNLLKKATGFWGYYLGIMCVLAMDYIIMSQTLSPVSITIYSILLRAFNIVFFAYQILLTILWPQMAELFFKKRWKRANSLLYKNMLIGFAVLIICTIIMIVFRHVIMHILAPHQNIQLPILAILLFCSYFIIRVWSDSFAIIIKSQNHTRIFWIYLPAQAIISSAAMYYLSIIWGLNGIILGLALSFITTAAWILPLAHRYLLKKHYK